MVLHKQLRVLDKGTNIRVVSVANKNQCIFEGVSEDILSKISVASNKYRNSFIKKVRLVKTPEVALEIFIKCKEE